MVAKLREEYRADIDIQKLASELVIDDIVPSSELREQIIRRFAQYADQGPLSHERKHLVPPV